MKSIDHIQCRGYIEGYYGRLLSWVERQALVTKLRELALTCYFYAPKEDIYHRFHWREPYPEQWRTEFRDFTKHAQANGVDVIAGVAPGLDFDFKHINQGADFKALVAKAAQLLNDGASAVALLMDDINTDFNSAETGFTSEGYAHATLANNLSEAIGSSVFIVPRVYANELEYESPGYSKAFTQCLHGGHAIFHCGTHIVAEAISDRDYAAYKDSIERRIVIWDNLYANDYCPRRLFVGPWSGRASQTEVMLNPTGMPFTDALLLNIMTSAAESSSIDAWRGVLREHNVPEAFDCLQTFFNHPPFAGVCDAVVDEVVLAEQLAAIEVLLWQWKTPLSREWYPYLFGLKHDLQLVTDTLPELRIRKTQPGPLASLLISRLK